MTNVDTDNCQVEPWLAIGEIVLRSRLLIGFEQYRSPSIIKAILDASGVELIILDVNPWQQEEGDIASVDVLSLGEIVDLTKYTVVGTTTSAVNAEQAIDRGLLLCESLKTRIVKLDVRPPRGQRRYPDNEQVLRAARELVRQGCIVLPMISPDLITALRLQDVGCAALRVLAGEIWMKSGIANQGLLKTIADAVEIPVIAEGGISKPSDVAIAMESGAKAVLVNTAIAQSSDPVRMARAMRLSVDAAYLFQVLNPRHLNG